MCLDSNVGIVGRVRFVWMRCTVYRMGSTLDQQQETSLTADMAAGIQMIHGLHCLVRVSVCVCVQSQFAVWLFVVVLYQPFIELYVLFSMQVLCVQ